jgi:hypothetical protein
LAGFLMENGGRRRFVVFDNTASSAGLRNALELQRITGASS